MAINKKSSSQFLYIYVFVLLTVIAVAIGIWLYNDIKEERIKDINYTTSVIKRYYELSFNQWGNSLLGLGQRLMEVDGDDAAQRRLDIVNASIKNYKELIAFGLTDTTGQVITFSGLGVNDSLPNLMLSKNSKRSFLLSKKVKDLSIGESYYFANVKDWILPVRVPIRNDSGILIAVNTTAIQYKSLNKDLSSFGFDSTYRIHLINKDFSTTQLYYPWPIEQYSEILQKDADIYKNNSSSYSNEISFFNAYNSLEKHDCIGIRISLPSLNHELVVSVEEIIIINEFKPYLLTIISLYLMLLSILGSSFVYSRRKEKTYISKLEDREANLKAIFESTSSIIGLFDNNHRLIEFNQAFTVYAKLAAGIVLTKNMDVFSQMSGPLVEVFKGYQQRALKGEKFKETIEYPGKDKTYYFLFSYHPIYRNNEISGVSMFVEDITALKMVQIELEKYTKNLEKIVKERTVELEKKNIALESGNEELAKAISELKNTQNQLVQIEKMASLGVLAAGIGHEINNPLNFIKNGLTALIQELNDYDFKQMTEVQPFIDIINDGVLRASKIVTSLSHFSRQQKSMDEDCNIEEIIEHCLVILNNKLKNKVEVTKDFDLQKGVVKGNGGRLHQVFLNILSNAEQAISVSGEIAISTKVKNDNIAIVIQDSGEGIDKENLLKIGDPFFTTKDPGEGTGLGLFITYSIIEEHKGKVNVKSEVNKGTSFEIILPIKYK